MLFGVVLFFIIMLVYFYIEKSRARKKLKDCGFPILSSSNWFLGNLDIFLSCDSVFKYGNLCKENGKTFGVYYGVYPAVITSDIDIIHEICVDQYDHFHAKMHHPLDPNPITSDDVHMFNATGERWKRLRTVTSKAVSSKNMMQLFEMMNESCRCFVEYLSQTDNAKSEVYNAHSLFQNHTSDVIARCVFGQQNSHHNHNTLLFRFQKLFGSKTAPDFSIGTIAWCFPVPIMLLQTLHNCYSYITKMFVKSSSSTFADLLFAYYEPRTAGKKQYDFLQILKNAEVETDIFPSEQKEGQVNFRNTKLSYQISQQELLAQLRFISVAGFDTTANTLAFLIHLLCGCPIRMKKLVEEIDKCEEINYYSAQSFPYMHNCILETLRLYPHASPLHQRRCMEDTKIGKFFFKKDVNIIVDTWSLHHDHSIWGINALNFQPERFENLTEKQKKAYMPFGLGPRQCIGKRFALMEIKATLYYLLTNYEIQTQNNKINVTVRDTGTIWPDNIPITLRRRQ